MSKRLAAMGCYDSIAYMTPARRQHHKPHVGRVWTAAGWLVLALAALAYIAALT